MRDRRRAAGAAALTLLVALAGCATIPTESGTTASDTEASATTTPSPGTVTCVYTASSSPAKPVDPPVTENVPATGTELVTLTLGGDPVQIELDRAAAPCTVNSFLSLAEQGYYTDTSCHRLTTSDSLKVLQCGDPTGTGTGGPGYRFPNEYPTNQYRLTDPAIEQPVVYPKGTLAMANAGPGTNGSQFFLVYDDSELPPTYTVFGSISPTGLSVLKLTGR